MVRRWGGERVTIYLPLHCHHQNDSCIKMGRGESHFNVSLIVRDKVTRECPQTTTFEEKGEPKQIRTEVPLLTSLTARPNQLTVRPNWCTVLTLHSVRLYTESQGFPRHKSGIIYTIKSTENFKTKSFQTEFEFYFVIFLPVGQKVYGKAGSSKMPL